MFDPYYSWLGIPPDEQPPNNYRLLGIRLFEDHEDAIANAADQRMAHLRTFQSGPNGRLSQKLLNEVAAARVCLLDAKKKAHYDAALRRTIESAEPTSTEDYRAALAGLAEQGRVDRATRPRRRTSPHLVPLVVVACIVVAALVMVWRIGTRGHEERKMAVNPEPVKTAPAPPAKKVVAEPKPVEQAPAKTEPSSAIKPEPAASAPVAKPEPLVSPPAPKPIATPEPKLEPKPEPKPEPSEAVANRLEEKLETLQENSRGAPPTVRRRVFDETQAFVREAIAADQYGLAVEAAKLAASEAGRLRDKELVKQARGTLQEAQQRQKAFAAVRAAKETLATNANDPAANESYGKFLCFAKGDWHRGLPLLAKAEGSPVKDLAAKDFADTNKPDEQVAIADGWWNAAEAQSLTERKNVLLHAAMWYYRTSFQLTGAKKTLAEKRIKQTGLETQITNKTDGSVLVLIPEGKFLSGPEKKVAYLPAYYLGMYEVICAQYERFIKATGHAPPTTAQGFAWAWTGKGFLPSLEDRPVGCIQWKEVGEYCRWAGLRPPTAIEWEKGARGTDGRVYPWGDDWDLMKCQNKISRGSGDTCPVASYPQGRSPWGLYNMAGNSWEWCQDDAARNTAIRCGGGCETPTAGRFTCWSRWAPPAEFRGLEHGFRVARDFRP